MDFIFGLSSSQSYNTIYTCIDKFTKFERLISCFKGKGALSAPECANLIFSHIIRLFGVPKIVLHDCDSRFNSNFWKDLWDLLRVKYFLQGPTICRWIYRLKGHIVQLNRL